MSINSNSKPAELAISRIVAGRKKQHYSQPVLAVIANSLRLAPDAAGSIVMAAQLGYMLFLAPLGDVLENRKLCSATTLGASVAALASSRAKNSLTALHLCIMAPSQIKSAF